MSSREAILHAVRQNRPDLVVLPDFASEAPGAADVVEVFTEAVIAAGGRVVAYAEGALGAAVRSHYPEGRIITSCLSSREIPGMRPFERGEGADYAKVEVLVCEGVLGVAESGAVWLPESRMGDRAAPFLAEHLALVLDRNALVFNLHEAYARLSVAGEGFGVFVAGPSKTADIEQSLVIGAHGPRSLTILLRS